MRRLVKNGDIARIRTSPLFDPGWYSNTYPDVARLPLDPASHFARVGAFLGRDPGPNFASRYYLATNPDVAAAGLSPLLHYLTAGQSEGRAPHPGVLPPRPAAPLRRLKHLRDLLETGGLDAGPRAALADMAEGGHGPDAAAGAAEALALMALRRNDNAEARHWLDTRIKISRDAMARLAPLMALAAARDGDVTTAQGVADAAPQTAALHLARIWWAKSEAETLACLNAALTQSNLLPVALQEGKGPLFDRLIPGMPRPANSPDSPVVSVLMAAFNCEDTIPTALRAMQAQSWTAFELLVIDDASTDNTPRIVAEYASQDPRIRLIPLSRNRGAYAARNAGLAEARGQFVTLHDADDWSHPDRLRLQIEFLLANRGIVGCLSQQARCTPDLRVSRWTGQGALFFENMTSLMLPTDLVRNCLGGWDDVRVSADSELLRRVRRLFGERAVAAPDTGPLALQRASDTSATADKSIGMDWFYYGARREYYEAQLHHHATAWHLCYPPDKARTFPAPDNLQTGRSETRLDRVYAGLLTVQDEALKRLLDWLNEDQAQGRKVGLVPLYASTMPSDGGISIHPHLRHLIDGTNLRVLCYGEEVHCERYIRLPGQSVTEPHRYLPTVHEGNRCVLSPGRVPAEQV